MKEIGEDAVPLLQSVPDEKPRSVQGVRPSFSNAQKAAYLVDRALARHLMPLEVLQHANYPKAKLAYAMYSQLSYIRSAALIILTLLPFFEEPEWCSNIMPNGHCEEPTEYLLSGVRYLHPLANILIKLLCICPLAVSLLLQHYYKFLTFWDSSTTWIKVGLLLAMGLPMIASVSQISWRFSSQSKQMGMYLCILIPIFFSRALRGCFRMTMRIGHSFLDTAGMLVAFILMSAWLANQLFHTANFEDFSTSLLSLFVMLTTANNPNVWAETYERNHYSFFFFFAYMIIAFYFLMHLLFALIYNNYKLQLATEVENHTATKRRNLRAAFDLLDRCQAGISVQNARTLFFEIGSYRHVHDLGAVVEEVVAGLKNRASDNIFFGEFQVLCNNFVRAIEAKLHEGPLVVQKSYLGIHCSEDILDSVAYKSLSFTATLASVVVAVLDRNLRDSDLPDVSFSKFLPSLETLTMCEFVLVWLFLANIVLRIWVQGIREYVRSFSNCFDFIATMSIMCLQISTVWYPNAYNWISVSVVIRSMRYVNILGYFHRWRVMGHLVISMIPAAVPILGFQLCVCSLFSIAGLHLFGGLVFVGNPKLQATEYASSGLWVYNYNDYGSAMVTSFNLCVVNNWYVIMDGYAAAMGSNWARAYFIIFWAVAVTFTLNVVVAFFVGAFTTQLEKAERGHSLYMLGPLTARKTPTATERLGSRVLMRSLSQYDLYEEIVRG